ncbi:ThuA domain-containing protein [Haloterrigena sp. SYSU A121-1]|uniref:ThuA domain-containing protein n=1 Tax=Haloterrigena gelatinilytica TaxID=2741724 RepID=A0A8J8GSC3_9EURY|nr:ThuA domain-containing protein [Haloterrigena gelatinilytica]NUB93609.1 ThuA domain-containing protein [Haloterrigena gelatinilytica]
MTTDKQALVVGGNRFPFHRLERMGPLIEDALAPAGIEVELTTDRESLTDLDGYDVLVDYTTDSTLTDAQREGLLSFVDAGNGYAGVHSASDLTTVDGENRDEPAPELRELIGGHFLTHPAQGAFDVNIVYSHHPVSADLEDFRVWDEPYVLECDDDLTVLARMDHPEIGEMPVSWVKEYGDGRVFYCSLGHDRPAITADGTRALLRNGVRWAADSSAGE